MLILGIDPGTATTGYGLVCETPESNLKVIDFGVISTPAETPMPERLLILYEQLNDLILLHRPDYGAVEKLFFQRNVTTAISVGQARGVILLALATSAISVAEYTPLEIKQSICGYGRADKHQVQEMVRALLELEKVPYPDDAADALAIAICHIHRMGFQKMIHDQSS
jgi:crossover junction endodeoxyribonuclease RuvC